MDPGHPSAGDSNSGSASEPWATLNHAANVAGAGDTVIVANGTYEEILAPQNSGSPGSPVIFKAASAHGAVIDGSSITLDIYGALVQVSDRSYVTIEGFKVVDAGPLDTSSGIQVDNSQHIVIQNNHTLRTASSGILVWGSDEVVVENNEVEEAMTRGATSENECITFGETSNFVARGNHVHHGSTIRGEGIDAKDGSSNGEVVGNHVHHVASVGLYVDSWDKSTHDIDVHENLVHDIGGAGISIASEMGGTLSRVRVFNNLVYDNTEVGLSLSGCCIASHPVSDVEIVNNTFVNNGQDPWGGSIHHENSQAQGVVIRNNIVSEGYLFQIALEGVPPGEVSVDYNLIHGFRGEVGETRGSNYQEGNPLFADAGNKDFHLTATSPGVDTGSSTAAPATDYDGNTRPQGTGMDMGAYEYPSGGGGGGGDCIETTTAACLNNERFKVEFEWESPPTFPLANALVASAGTGDSALFYYQNPENWEVLVKVLNACTLNNKYWVFASVASDVAWTLKVTDTDNGTIKTWDHLAGTPSLSVNDTGAFDTCP